MIVIISPLAPIGEPKPGTIPHAVISSSCAGRIELALAALESLLSSTSISPLMIATISLSFSSPVLSLIKVPTINTALAVCLASIFNRAVKSSIVFAPGVTIFSRGFSSSLKYSFLKDATCLLAVYPQCLHVMIVSSPIGERYMYS